MMFRGLICFFKGHRWLKMNNDGTFLNNYICVRCAKAVPSIKVDNTTKWQCSECLEGNNPENVRACILDFGREIKDGENWDGPTTCPLSGTDCRWRPVTDDRTV